MKHFFSLMCRRNCVRTVLPIQYRIDAADAFSHAVQSWKIPFAHSLSSFRPILRVMRGEYRLEWVRACANNATCASSVREATWASAPEIVTPNRFAIISIAFSIRIDHFARLQYISASVRCRVMWPSRRAGRKTKASGSNAITFNLFGLRLSIWPIWPISSTTISAVVDIRLHQRFSATDVR